MASTQADDTPGAGTTQPAPASRAAQASRLRRLLANPQVEGSVTVVAFLVLFAGYGVWLGSLFFNIDARLLDVHQNVPIILLGLAVMVTLVAGQFDLSVASMATLTTFLTIGLATKDGLPFGLVLAICLAVGMVGGLINALLVEKVGVNAFIATLGTTGLFVGISKIYSSGTQLTPTPDSPLPKWFTDFGAYTQKFPAFLLWIAVALAAFAGFTALARVKPAKTADRTWMGARIGIVAVVLLLLVLVANLPRIVNESSWLVGVIVVVGFVMWILMEFTTYGRYLRASGANRSAARLAGVQVQREVVKAFVIGGLLAALAGVCLGASQGSAAPDVAAGFLLPAFAAAFLSTVVFSTGRFTVWGTMIGAIFIVWVSQGLIVGGVSPTWTDVVNGLVLVSAVALSSVIRRRQS
jgi:ribose/xylose/arabinose/galactoside ABC-type transport system permease subunit